MNAWKERPTVGMGNGPPSGSGHPSRRATRRRVKPAAPLGPVTNIKPKAEKSRQGPTFSEHQLWTRLRQKQESVSPLSNFPLLRDFQTGTCMFLICHEKEAGRADVLAFILWTRNPWLRGIKVPGNKATRPARSAAGLEQGTFTSALSNIPCCPFLPLIPHLWM